MWVGVVVPQKGDARLKMASVCWLVVGIQQLVGNTLQVARQGPSVCESSPTLGITTYPGNMTLKGI